MEAWSSRWEDTVLSVIYLQIGHFGGFSELVQFHILCANKWVFIWDGWRALTCPADGDHAVCVCSQWEEHVHHTPSWIQHVCVLCWIKCLLSVSASFSPLYLAFESVVCFPFCFAQFDITAHVSIVSQPFHSLPHFIILLCMGRDRCWACAHTLIDQAHSSCSGRLLGFCGWRLFLSYYRKQMPVRRCSLSRLYCFRTAFSSVTLPFYVCFYSSPFLSLSRLFCNFTWPFYTQLLSCSVLFL